MPTALIVLLSICATLFVIGIFGALIPRVELATVEWFSRMTARPRWFSLWLVITIIWITARFGLEAAHVTWWTPDIDLIVITLLFSVAPAQTEYALKYANGLQMEALQKLLEKGYSLEQEQGLLITSIREELDHAKARDTQLLDLLHEQKERDKAFFALLGKIEPKGGGAP